MPKQPGTLWCGWVGRLCFCPLSRRFYHFPPTTTEMAYVVPIRTDDDATDSTCVLVPQVIPAGLRVVNRVHARVCIQVRARVCVDVCACVRMCRCRWRLRLVHGSVRGAKEAVVAATLPPDPSLAPRHALPPRPSQDPAKKGAGLVLKYVVDGGAEALPSGQSAQQAGYEAHMAFCQYLAHKSVCLDVWDAESLLQVGGVWAGPVRQRTTRTHPLLLFLAVAAAPCPAGRPAISSSALLRVG